MRLRLRPNKAADIYTLVCKNSYCNRQYSIRHHTFLDNSTLTMNEIVRIIFHYFVRNYNATETAKEILETVVSN
jgi:hypothetical protein